MKIGITEGSFRVHGDTRFEKIRSFGFRAVDYGMSDTKGFLYTCTEQERTTFLQKEKTLAETAGIEISQVHGPWRWPCDDATPEARAERFEKMALSIRMTAALGCKNWVVHPIMPFGTDEAGTPDAPKTWALNVEFMRKLLPVAEETEVTICLETMPFRQFSISRPADILRLVEEIDHPLFQICVDTGHIAMFRDLSVADEIRKLGNRIRALHIHDNNGNADQHQLPYWGIINWAEVGEALKEVGFDGTFSLETAPSSRLPADIREDMCRIAFRIANGIANA